MQANFASFHLLQSPQFWFIPFQLFSWFSTTTKKLLFSLSLSLSLLSFFYILYGNNESKKIYNENELKYTQLQNE